MVSTKVWGCWQDGWAVVELELRVLKTKLKSAGKEANEKQVDTHPRTQKLEEQLNHTELDCEKCV